MKVDDADKVIEWVTEVLAQERQVGFARRWLTSAAHHAGFADSAHLSLTFRRLSGMAAALRLE